MKTSITPMNTPPISLQNMHICNVLLSQMKKLRLRGYMIFPVEVGLNI